MLYTVCLVVFVLGTNVRSLSWSTLENIRPWEAYLQLGDICRPLGLTLNQSSIAHRHFYIGYLCLHSFMYDEAQEAFDLAINKTPTLIEAYIGKMLGCKQALWSVTDVQCGRTAYNASQTMLKTFNITLSNLQSSLLSTVYLWYANEFNVTAGEWAFLASISNLSQVYSNETDIRALWGLSLLNVAEQVQYQTQIEPPQMITAREKLKEVLNNEPNHSSALHYLIHAYDVVKVDIAEQARDYALSYKKIAITSSHAQHMPSHIWMRTGSWNLGLSSDGQGLLASLTLCATKLLNRTVSLNSIDLNSVLTLFNATQIPFLLQCDAENRAHSIEWLSYLCLQTGNWSGSVALLRDLFMADKLSSRTLNHYLPFAYRTQARTIVELFFWFEYDVRFANKTQQLLALNGSQTIVMVGDNSTKWYPIWGEAGIRFSECLRLLTMTNSSNNTLIVNNHLNRLAVLSNRTSSLNQYISTSISIMIPQIRGIRHYINQSWQECLNAFSDATQREAKLVPDANTPTLIFARSSELLAMHLLLIHHNYLQQSGRMLMMKYILNGTEISIHEFPPRALALYQLANTSAPNRAINTLGIARAYVQLHNNSEAMRLYQLLKTQITPSNNTDALFAQEVIKSMVEISENKNSAARHKHIVLPFMLILAIFIN